MFYCCAYLCHKCRKHNYNDCVLEGIVCLYISQLLLKKLVVHATYVKQTLGMHVCTHIRTHTYDQSL